MKQLYDQKITQYSKEGKLLNTFENATDASKKFSRYDSIIECCLGKNKTGGGYVWRFEGDPFSVQYNRKLKGEIHKCKICGNEETIRSFGTHLRWFHNGEINTNEYVEKYGEFRPAKLIQLKKKEISDFKCEECGKALNSNQHLMYHLTKVHPEITQSEYITKYLLKEEDNSIYLEPPPKEFIDFITSIYPGEIQTSVRNVIPKGEIDIYLPELKIGIEYNGLYWHSEKGGRFKDYHIGKLNKATLSGIRLIQIFSDEWINKKDIVKSKIQSILKVNPPTKIVYARKCEIREIIPQEKNIFLKKHHIQGTDRSNVKLGLYYEETLVGIMTFSHPRKALGGKQKDNEYELSRYTSSSPIIGGADKLLKHFVKNHNPSSIYSYSDNRWTDPNNNMYLNMGFEKTSTSLPGYFYTKDYLVRHHRYSFNKFKLGEMGFDISKTEKQIMEEIGYTRVWDCGNTKYTLTIKFGLPKN